MSTSNVNNDPVLSKGNTGQYPTCDEVYLETDPQYTPGSPGLSGQGFTLIVLIPLSAGSVSWMIYKIVQYAVSI